MALVEAPPDAKAVKGDFIEWRVYYAPSLFGSYEDDKKAIISKWKEMAAEPGSVLGKLQLLAVRNVVSPAPGDELQKPYIAFETRVTENPWFIYLAILAVGAVIGFFIAQPEAVKAFVEAGAATLKATASFLGGGGFWIVAALVGLYLLTDFTKARKAKGP